MRSQNLRSETKNNFRGLNKTPGQSDTNNVSQPASATQEYLKNAVMTASSEQLQLMLIDGAIRFALKGRQAIESGDFEGMFQALDRAQKIVLQISLGLQEEQNPAIVKQMKSLHNFIYRRLVDAHFHRDVAAVDDAVQILRHQRDTWVIIAEKVATAGTTQPDTAATRQARVAPATSPVAQPAAQRPSRFVQNSPGSESTLSVEG